MWDDEAAAAAEGSILSKVEEGGRRWEVEGGSILSKVETPRPARSAARDCRLGGSCLWSPVPHTVHDP